MGTQFDYYREISRTRAATQGILAVQAVQTVFLNDISNSLGSIHSEMAAIRATADQGLALQQEMLQREVIQSRLEEFIYQMQKVVTEFEKSDGAYPSSTRYFLLKGMLETIEQEGIGTPVIRGRENKATFEATTAKVREMTTRLLKDAEVQEAIAWSQAEQKRLDDERQKQAQERARMQREKEARMADIRNKIQSLRSSRQSINFKTWYEAKVSPWAGRFVQNNPALSHLLVWVFGGAFLIPPWYFISKLLADKSLNQSVDSQIQSLEAELRSVQQS